MMEILEFLSTPSARRATSISASSLPKSRISIHALREEGDAAGRHGFYPRRISIHALREEGDQRHGLPWQTAFYFYPRPPRGGRLQFLPVLDPGGGFLSTPSARRATCSRQGAGPWQTISIHALREEGDSMWMLRMPLTPYFYPRPPRGGRPSRVFDNYSDTIFLSTPSARRATRGYGDHLLQAGFLSTPSARRATPKILNQKYRKEFLSTPSARRATRHVPASRGDNHISIHALREEGDQQLLWCSPRSDDFYPRPPRGGRQQKQRQNLYFQTNYTTFCTNLEEP